MADEVEGESCDAFGHVLACLTAGGRAGERLVHHLAAAAGELVDDRVGVFVGRQVQRRRAGWIHRWAVLCHGRGTD